MLNITFFARRPVCSPGLIVLLHSFRVHAHIVLFVESLLGVAGLLVSILSSAGADKLTVVKYINFSGYVLLFGTGNCFFVLGASPLGMEVVFLDA